MGKCSVMETRGGSRSILREEAARGRGVEPGVGGPPVLPGRPGVDPQPGHFSKLPGSWRTMWRLSGRHKDSGGNAMRPHISGSGREIRGWLLGGGRAAKTRETRVGLQAPGKSLGGSSGEWRRRARRGRAPGWVGESAMSQRSAAPAGERWEAAPAAWRGPGARLPPSKFTLGLRRRGGNDRAAGLEPLSTEPQHGRRPPPLSIG